MLPFYSLLIILVLSPLPIGCNRPWSWSLLCLLISLTSIGWCITYWRKQKETITHFNHFKYPLLLFNFTLFWALLQTSTFIPAEWGHPLWKITGNALGREIPPRISLEPEMTITAIMRLMCYGLVFFLSFQCCLKPENTAKLFQWLASAGFIYASYGLIGYLGDFNTTLWVDTEVNKNNVTGTFINRNSYATYAGLVLLCLVPNLRSKFKTSMNFGFEGNFGKQMFFESLVTRAWFSFLMFITIGTSLFLTFSRGGFLSTSLALIVLIILLGIKNKSAAGSGYRSRFCYLNYFSLAIISLCVVLYSVSGGKVMDRLGQTDVDKAERPKVYSVLAESITGNPVLGVGYGTFDNSFRIYRTKDISSNYDKAHNTYLENIFELGIPAALTLILSIVLIATRCFIGIWVRQRNWIYPAIGFSASILVAVHSLVDFSLQIPAVAVTYAAMLGAGFAQSFSSRKKGEFGIIG